MGKRGVSCGWLQACQIVRVSKKAPAPGVSKGRVLLLQLCWRGHELLLYSASTVGAHLRETATPLQSATGELQVQSVVECRQRSCPSTTTAVVDCPVLRYSCTAVLLYYCISSSHALACSLHGFLRFQGLTKLLRTRVLNRSNSQGSHKRRRKMRVPTNPLTH